YQKSTEVQLVLEQRTNLDGNTTDDRFNSNNPGGTDIFGRAASTENKGFFETIASLPGLVWRSRVLYRIVVAPTCEHGGHSYVRSGCVSPRSHRRDHHHCRLATARDRPFQSHLHAPSVSALWSPGLSGQAVPADPARLGESRRVVSA